MLAPRKAQTRTTALLGQIRRRARRPSEPQPVRLWDARLGFFAVRPDDVDDMTPAQLLGCVDLFAAMHGAGE